MDIVGQFLSYWSEFKNCQDNDLMRLDVYVLQIVYRIMYENQISVDNELVGLYRWTTTDGIVSLYHMSSDKIDDLKKYIG